MAADHHPFNIPTRATVAEVQDSLYRLVPVGAEVDQIEHYFSHSGFRCQGTKKKLVCRMERRVNAIQKEVWILAFDLDETGHILARRVSHGYVAP